MRRYRRDLFLSTNAAVNLRAMSRTKGQLGGKRFPNGRYRRIINDIGSECLPHGGMLLNAFLERMNRWNQRMNGLPRKAMLIMFTMLGTWLLVKIAPLTWPFLLAMLFSMLLEPLMRFGLSHAKRVKVSRGILTLLGMAVLFGVLGVALFVTARQLIRELVSLAYATPNFVRWLSGTVVPKVQELYQQYSDVLPAGVMEVVNNSLASVGQSAIRFAGTLSASLTGGAVKLTAAIPGMVLSVVLTIMGTYYMTADRERILAFFRRTFPVNVQKHGQMLKRNLFRSLFGQVKSQLTVSVIIITFLILVFVLSGVEYGLLIGLLIGVADALPVIGAGLFLIPWCIFQFVMGNYGMGIFLAAVYVGTIIIRQISEPRIVGANLGLYPLATMVAIFAGFQLFGVLGLLGGPILLNLLKVVLEADEIARGVKEQPRRAHIRILGTALRPQDGDEAEQPIDEHAMAENDAAPAQDSKTPPNKSNL